MKVINTRPLLFEKTDNNIWTDSYIQQQMLKEHLNPLSDGASRKKESIIKILDFIQANSMPKSKLLDLGCGPGLYTYIFHEKHYSVTGIDFNKASIDYAKSQNENIQYIEGDYISNYPKDIFDTVIMIYCDLGTHSDTNRDILLRNIYNSLEKDGVFIFDIFTEERTKDKSEGKNWEYNSDGGFWSQNEYLLLSETFHYPQEKAFAYQYNLFTNNTQKNFIVWDRYYSENEIISILEDVGFSKIEVHKNILDDNNFTSSSEMFVIARK